MSIRTPQAAENNMIVPPKEDAQDQDREGKYAEMVMNRKRRRLFLFSLLLVW
jgi:hypothetical protein